MCENPQYALMLKSKYDSKFKRFGVRSKLRILGYVRDYENNCCNVPHYDKTRYNLIIKECGKCRTCRYKQAAKKAAQGYCESRLHTENCFLTLTFDQHKLFDYFYTTKKKSKYLATKMTHMCQWTLEKKLFTDFVKRLRDFIEQEDIKNYLISNNMKAFLFNKDGSLKKRFKVPQVLRQHIKFRKIKLLHCGEYGDLGERPHHHCIIFGYNFPDVYKEKYYRQGQLKTRYVSDILNSIWKLGDCTCDSCTYSSINYVSRYVTKKIVGKKSDEFYQGRMPEYCTSSNRRGLGYEYFVKHYREFINTEKIAIKGKNGKIINVSLPRYFRDIWKKLDPVSYNQSVEKNIEKSLKIFENIKKVGLKSHLDSISSITKTIHSRLKRQYENTYYRSAIDVIHRKALAFGIDPYLYDNYQSLFDRYLSFKNYRCFGLKFKNSDLHDKFVRFEQFRTKKINDIKYNIYLSDSDIKFYIDFYSSLKNPYRKNGYSAKIYVYPDEHSVLSFENSLDFFNQYQYNNCCS